MRRIVLTTVGSLGDLHLYVAIALGLKARGHKAILATSACYQQKIEGMVRGENGVQAACEYGRLALPGLP